MFLSIGNDMAVRDRSIIGIFDLDNTSTSKRTREFLNRAEREGEVIPCDDLPKSFILTAEYGFSRVHLTALNAATLEKRLSKDFNAKNVHFLLEMHIFHDYFYFVPKIRSPASPRPGTI